MHEMVRHGWVLSQRARRRCGVHRAEGHPRLFCIGRNYGEAGFVFTTKNTKAEGHGAVGLRVFTEGNEGKQSRPAYAKASGGQAA